VVEGTARTIQEKGSNKRAIGSLEGYLYREGGKSRRGKIRIEEEGKKEDNKEGNSHPKRGTTEKTGGLKGKVEKGCFG